MLTFVAIAAIVLLGIAFMLIARGLFSPESASSETVSQIGAYGFSGVTRERCREPGERRSLRGFFDGIAVWLGEHLGSRLSRLSATELRERLISAGMYTTSPGRIFGYQCLLAFVLPLTLAVDCRPGRHRPDPVHRGRHPARGLRLDPSPRLHQQHASQAPRDDRVRPPRPDRPPRRHDRGRLELHRVASGCGSQNVRAARAGAAPDAPGAEHGPDAVGVPPEPPSPRRYPGHPLVRARHDARRATRRLDRPDHATLADEMRKKRKAAAEERAQKAPIKLLFPLLIFIFPAMFVIILLPALLRIADTLG